MPNGTISSLTCPHLKDMDGPRSTIFVKGSRHPDGSCSEPCPAPCPPPPAASMRLPLTGRCRSATLSQSTLPQAHEYLALRAPSPSSSAPRMPRTLGFVHPAISALGRVCVCRSLRTIGRGSPLLPRRG